MSQQKKIKIDICCCGGFELLKELERSDYDFVVLHIGEKKSAYETANKCRELTNNILVAESSSYPDGSQEILKYFDDYIGLLYYGEFLKSLLIRHGFIFED